MPLIKNSKLSVGTEVVEFHVRKCRHRPSNYNIGLIHVNKTSDRMPDVGNLHTNSNTSSQSEL